MPEVDTFETPAGKTFHGALLQSVTESFVGNGIQNDGDGEVTADGGTANGIDVAASTKLRYSGSSYDVAADSFTLSNGPTTNTNGEDDRRVDAVVFDRTLDAGNGGYQVLEGADGPNPEPPSISGDQLLLALCLIEHSSNDIQDDNILNWRAHAAVDYQVETAEITDSGVTTAKVNNGAVTTVKISDGSVTTAKIKTGAVGTNELANSAVTTAKLNSGAVDTDALAADSVTATEIVDGQVSSAEIADAAVGSAQIASGAVGTGELSDGAVTDAKVSGSTTIGRTKVDDERIKSATKTSNYTTGGDEVVPVDTSGGPVTITLATSDLGGTARANFVIIADVGGSADTNPITVDTESGENINGGTSITVDDAYGATVVFADNTEWYTAGGGTGGGKIVTQDDGSTAVSETSTVNFRKGIQAKDSGDGETANIRYEHTETFEGSGGKNGLANGNQAVLIVDGLADGATVEVYKCGLVDGNIDAVPTDVDLKLVTFDNSGGFTTQSTLISGDGATIYDRVTGSPAGSYTNSSGAEQTVGVLVDNQSGGSVDVGNAYAEGVTNA
jgi:hypothetical protein